MHDMKGLKDRVEREIQEIMGEKQWTSRHAEVLEELLNCEKCIKEIERYGKADSHYYPPMMDEYEEPENYIYPHMPPMKYHYKEKEYPPYMSPSRPYMPIHVNYHKTPMPYYPYDEPRMPMDYGYDPMIRPYEYGRERYGYDDYERRGRGRGRGRRYYEDDDDDEKERKHYESSSSSNGSTTANSGSNSTPTTTSTGGSTSVKR